jgi:hypothetical protein
VESITSATVLHEDDIIRGNLEEDSEGVWQWIPCRVVVCSGELGAVTSLAMALLAAFCFPLACKCVVYSCWVWIWLTDIR